MLNSQPTKIIKDKVKKINLTKKDKKKYRFEKNKDQIWHKRKGKGNQIMRDEIEKQFQLKMDKKKKTKNNQKNKDQTWYKNQM